MIWDRLILVDRSYRTRPGQPGAMESTFPAVQEGGRALNK